MKYDFDAAINRYNTNSIKWDFTEEIFGIRDALPMWIADMDFRAPQSIIKAVRKVADHGIFGYSGVLPSYWKALRDWMKRRHKWDIEKEWVIFTPGGVVALNLIAQAFTKPGDKVIVQTPVYYPFFDAIKSGDCEILDNPLKYDGSRYFMDLEDLKRKIDSHTKIIILCSPHNPVGRVWQEDELRKLGEICINNNILIVSDEIHQDIIFNGFQHIPFATLSDKFSDSSITVTGISKTFNLAGLQMTNIVIPNSSIRRRFKKRVEDCGLLTPNIFAIAATEAAYRNGESWLEQLMEYLQGNLSFLNDYVSEEIPGLKVIQPEGTYLVWLDFRDCGIDPSRLCDFVREDAKVALDEGMKFGSKEVGFERINIACPRVTLANGLERIAKAAKKLRK
jgi:cystathionine beta-lyase